MNKRQRFRPVLSKIDFPDFEKKLLKKWYEESVVKRYLHRNDDATEKFSFLDGPITANNPMGVHHAWGRTYKDFYQRFWNMKGRKQRFQNGFDEQGLWVEVEVEKELGLKSKKEIENLVPGDKFKSLEKFINLCKERVKKFSAIQTEQSKRLGYFMNWENSYHTSSDENNYAIWNFLKVVNEKGWLYKGRDSVPWCPRCGTAISQHEILTEEYKEITHKTVVFKLKIKDRENEYFLAWTTTPWTIPGNTALAIDPDLSYWKMINKKKEKIIVIDPMVGNGVERSEMLVNKLKLLEGFEKIEEMKGSKLIGIEYQAPYDYFPAVKKSLGDYKHRVVAAEAKILKINPEEGTGIVHIAPGAGTEDFRLSLKENLPVIEEIDEEGIFLEGFDFISKKSVKEASELILDDLESRNLAMKIADYLHRYPTCWRCKTELVWRVVDEWYIAMDRPDESGKTYREQMIEVAKQIVWMPNWGLEREIDWLSNMHDWLISKKRYWGLALPIWECSSCGKFEVIGGKEELKNKAYSGYQKFEGNSPHRPWVDQIKIKCRFCGKIASRILDVGNPWLDAGIVPFSTLPKDWFPADFITESFPGQFKNWFYSLIAMSTAIKRTAPFKRVLGFGSVRDEKGEEMHKSRGNAIEFNEAADKIGVDVMRWLYLRTNPEHNVNFGYHVTDETRRFFHLRLWNIYSFFVMYANIDGWNLSRIQKSKARSQKLLDKWIISRMNRSLKLVSNFIEEYNAAEATQIIENFIINDLSTWYVRRIRDRVGPTAEDRESKNSAYSTLWEILTTYSKVLAPFIPFISDEIYTNLTGETSVHLADWPKFDESLVNESLEKEMVLVREIVEIALAQRKAKAVKVRQPLSELKVRNLKLRLSEELIGLIKDEINVKNVIQETGKGELDIELNFEISDQLKKEGEAREIVRRIQEERKKLGTRLDEKVDLEIDKWPEEFQEYIKKNALVDQIKKGERFLVIRK